MLTHPTLDQMHQLGLAGMARAFAEFWRRIRQSADLSHAEWLGLLLDREATDRYERRLRARLRYARLRHQAAVEDVDYLSPSRPRPRTVSGADRRALDRRGAEPGRRRAGRCRQELAGLRPRTKACRELLCSISAFPGMFGDLALARGDGRYPRLMRALGGVKLLILDDWGLEPKAPGPSSDTQYCSISSKTAMAAAPP